MIRKNDNVIVITGKDKGKKGKVVRAFPKEDKVIIEGVNIAKRMERAKKVGQKGQVIQKPMPIHISNVMIYCSSCGKGVRTGAKMIGEKMARVCKKCGKEI